MHELRERQEKKTRESGKQLHLRIVASFVALGFECLIFSNKSAKKSEKKKEKNQRYLAF
jgi:hypothetical protein